MEERHVSVSTRIDDADLLAEELRLLHGVSVPVHDMASNAETHATLVAEMHRQGLGSGRSALCLSGGGIRSATFNLGMLQGLARQGLLSQFTYLSTVSGGGYIGSWLTAWIYQEQKRRLKPEEPGLEAPNSAAAYQDAVKSVSSQLASAEAGVATEPEPIKRLRAYSRFLTPTKGMSGDAMSLIATYVRNLLLNWLVLIPLILAALIVPRLFLSALQSNPVSPEVAHALAALVVLGVLLTIAYMASDLPGTVLSDEDSKKPVVLRTPTWDNVWTLGVAPLLTAAASLAVLVFWHENGHVDVSLLWPLDLVVQSAKRLTSEYYLAIAFSVAGVCIHTVGGMIGGLVLRPLRRAVPGRRLGDLRVWPGPILSGAVGGALLGLALKALHGSGSLAVLNKGTSEVFATTAVPVLLFVFWLGVVVFAGVQQRWTSEDDREWWSRATGCWLAAAVLWLLLFGLVLNIPPYVADVPVLRDIGSAGLSVGAALVGLATAVSGFLGKDGPQLKQRAEGVANAVGLKLLDLASLVFVAVLLLGLCFAAPKIAGLAVTTLQDATTEANNAAEKRAQGRLDELRAANRSTVGQSPERLKCSPNCAGPVERLAAQYRAYLSMPNLGVALTAVFAGLAATGYLVSLAIGVNAFSMHGMYGNRLVRAYLGASRSRRLPHWFTGFDRNDNVFMKDLAGGADNRNVGRPVLFPVVNMALNLVAPAANRLEWQDRKATAFTASPIAVGSKTTGYVRTEQYTSSAFGEPKTRGAPPSNFVPSGGSVAAQTTDVPGGRSVDSGHSPQQRTDTQAPPVARSRFGLTLGRAMTASGAAASPNMGYSTSTLVSFVMTLFNVRLGVWMPNPLAKFERHWLNREPRSGLGALLDEALGRANESKPFVYLSDGGHFENLGLYEMVRRRCSRIVLSDATCDPDYQFEDLLNSIRLIRIDLGIVIDFPTELPRPGSKNRCAIGVIRYSSADKGAPDGVLYYFKPVMLGDESGDLAQYAEATKAKGGGFPQQTTSDQFYSETQFESYRKLGLHTATKCFVVPRQWPATTPQVQKTPMGILFSASSSKSIGPSGAVASGNAAPASTAKNVAQAIKDIKPGAEWLAPLVLASTIGITVVGPSQDRVPAPPVVSPGTDELKKSLSDLKVAADESTASLRIQNGQLQSFEQAVSAAANGLAGPASSPTGGLIQAFGKAASEAERFSESKFSTSAASAALAAQQAATGLSAVDSAIRPATVSSLSALAGAASSAASSLASFRGSASSPPLAVKLDDASLTKLTDIDTKLDRISKDMAQVPPRKNIRGSGEASK